MWAVLGDIEVEVLDSPDSWEERFGGQFAEHERVSDKPLLEAVGGKLQEISWTVRLHHHLHAVADRLRALQAAAQAQQPLALTLGSGVYRGAWVLGDCSVTVRKTAQNGALLSVDVAIVLREYAGRFEPPVARPGVLGDAEKLGSLATLQLSVTPAQRVLVAARDVRGRIRAARSGVAEVHTLAITKPEQALREVPQLLRRVASGTQAGQALQVAAGALDGAAELAALGAGVAGDMARVADTLSHAASATIAERLQQVGVTLRAADERYADLVSIIMRLAAAVATRQW